MELHPLASQFASVADAYERGRPEYAPAVVGALAAELGLRPGDPVLDLGAGTGKLTRALLAGGLDVIAVEPQGPLLEKLAEKVGTERIREGVAEAIPLEQSSVAGVTVADAFHWFDPQPSLMEVARVLRPGGGLAVISTAPDWSGASWAHELGGIVTESRPEHPHFDGPSWKESVRAGGGWTEPREVRVTATQSADPERIVDHMASMSWIAGMPEDERASTIERMRALIGSGETPDEMPIHFVIGLTARA
ncbi:MAG TPA: methyltransferase domain-containing protein [Solirubrobacteraceae bacterium]